MGLEKKTYVDKYEIVGVHKAIQVRTRTSIMEDGKEISKSFFRKVLFPENDISGEIQEIKTLAAAIWTADVKKARTDWLKAEKEARAAEGGE